MGYVLEFWALDRAELVAELRRSRLAELVSAGGAALPAGPAAEIVELVRRLGFLSGSLDHSSGGGTWFFGQFDASGAVAAALGADTAGHLLDRPIEGLATETFPMVGWLAHGEIAEALAGARPEPGSDGDAAELVDDVLTALRIAADRGQDVVTIYT